ncbi:MAG: TetR/AcrR family transcriptional regulator [Ruegeria sp.]
MARRSDHTRGELKEMIVESATRIVADEGLEKLTIRRIAKEIGYTSGTLYLLFESRDDLIVELHINTLQKLHACLSEVNLEKSAEEALTGLASSYLGFIQENPNLWNAVFEHRLSQGKVTPERYDRAIFSLIDLGVAAIRPLYPESRVEEAIHDARVLWASLYGIAALDVSDKLSRYESSERFIESLMKNYVAGIRQSMAEDISRQRVEDRPADTTL